MQAAWLLIKILQKTNWSSMGISLVYMLEHRIIPQVVCNRLNIDFSNFLPQIVLDYSIRILYFFSPSSNLFQSVRVGIESYKEQTL